MLLDTGRRTRLGGLGRLLWLLLLLLLPRGLLLGLHRRGSLRMRLLLLGALRDACCC